jgi:hypothetical protein
MCEISRSKDHGSPFHSNIVLPSLKALIEDYCKNTVDYRKEIKTQMGQHL